MKVWRLLSSSNATTIMVKNDKLHIIFSNIPVEMKVVKKGKHSASLNRPFETTSLTITQFVFKRN